ncbi:hypothetical protein GCK32_002549, partial [Trichostrongylus colubriformis]
YVVCEAFAPIHHNELLFRVYILYSAVSNVLILICYTLVMYFIRKAQMSECSTKQIYRSLIIISLTTVFDRLCIIAIAFIEKAGGFQMARIQISLLAGLFVNFSSAINFFVYYACRWVGLAIAVCSKPEFFGILCEFLTIN